MDNDTITIVQQLPSAKEQVKAAAIGLGISLAATVVIIGGLTLATRVATELNERKSRRAAAKLANQ